MDTLLAVLLGTSGFFLVLVGIYLAVSPVDPNDHLTIWQRKKTRRALILVIVLGAINIITAVVQAVRTSVQQGVLVGKLSDANSKLDKAQDKIGELQKAEGEAQGTLTTVLGEVRSGRLSTDQAVQILANLNLRLSSATPPDFLAIISSSAARLAASMKQEMATAGRQYESEQRMNRVEMYQSAISKGMPPEAAAAYLQQPPGPASAVPRNSAMTFAERNILNGRQQEIEAILKLAKANIPASYKAIKDAEAAVDDECLHPMFLDQMPGNGLDPCAAALNNLSSAIGTNRNR